jgi:serine/threonine-protein kinase
VQNVQGAGSLVEFWRGFVDDLARWEYLKARVPQGYEPIGTLGSGGGAAVLHARSTRFSSEVAIKIAHEERGDDHITNLRREAIRSEARVLEKMRGVRGVVTLRGCEETAHGPVLVLERIEGRSLTAYMRHSPITLGQALRLLARAAEVVDAIHGRGVIHRDLKPDNLLVVAGPGRYLRPIVIDFGLARFREAASDTYVSGSPHYMAPEAFDPLHAEEGVERDIYALGVMLFEMCTGRKPFHGDTIHMIYGQHALTTPPRLRDLYPAAGYSDGLEALVRVSLAKSRRKRLCDAMAFARVIHDEISHLGPVAEMPLPIIKIRRNDELAPTQFQSVDH